MKKSIPWFAAVLSFFLAACACAQTVDVKALAAAMKEGGYVIVLRHGATNRDQADTDPLNHDNITKQRLLSVNSHSNLTRDFHRILTHP